MLKTPVLTTVSRFSCPGKIRESLGRDLHVELFLSNRILAPSVRKVLHACLEQVVASAKAEI